MIVLHICQDLALHYQFTIAFSESSHHSRPFDSNLYEDEVDEDEVLDEEGRARLKLKVRGRGGSWSVQVARIPVGRVLLASSV